MNVFEIKILVVDDDTDILHGTARLMEQVGYAVSRASSGEETIQMIHKRRPDLLLLDRHMSGIDGIDLCRMIKSDPALSDIFVVLVSGSYTASEEQAEGLEAGADGYIARPIANREMLARVDAFVRILRLNRVLHAKNAALQVALAKVKLLSGLLPICAGCKKIRDDQGYWSQVESYIGKHSEATFTHGLCPDCTKKYFPEEGGSEKK